MLASWRENLAENAIRYAGPGRDFTSRSRASDDGVVLSGRDDGIGVAEADLPRLFERFYRADRARASRGTGLGLAIVKHIVARPAGRSRRAGARGRGLEIRCVVPARVASRLHHIFHQTFTTRRPGRGRRPTTTRAHGNKREACAMTALAARPARAASPAAAAVAASDDAPATPDGTRRRRRTSDLSGRIEADGSSTVGPLTTAAAEGFQGESRTSR